MKLRLCKLALNGEHKAPTYFLFLGWTHVACSLETFQAHRLELNNNKLLPASTAAAIVKEVSSRLELTATFSSEVQPRTSSQLVSHTGCWWATKLLHDYAPLPISNRQSGKFLPPKAGAGVKTIVPVKKSTRGRSVERLTLGQNSGYQLPECISSQYNMWAVFLFLYMCQAS